MPILNRIYTECKKCNKLISFDFSKQDNLSDSLKTMYFIICTINFSFNIISNV